MNLHFILGSFLHAFTGWQWIELVAVVILAGTAIERNCKEWIKRAGEK